MFLTLQKKSNLSFFYLTDSPYRRKQYGQWNETCGNSTRQSFTNCYDPNSETFVNDWFCPGQIEAKWENGSVGVPCYSE